ncbi:MAG: 30S ribosomal protein S4 [Pirellulales bacterium]|nr:30S ribosomal protein S4 [Pirellulales bacterium]
MAHYTGPKGRVNRRLGVMIYENGGARRALERRDSPPGMHTRRGKLSVYGQALLEKQKIKHFYGLGERTLRRIFARAQRTEGNTADALIALLERRLDNVVRRAGFCATRPQSRQGVAHGHFAVNGRKADRPSLLVRPGDVIDVIRRSNLAQIYRDRIETVEGEQPTWLERETDNLRIHIRALPIAEDVRLPIDIGLAVEALSRS